MKESFRKIKDMGKALKNHQQEFLYEKENGKKINLLSEYFNKMCCCLVSVNTTI